MTLVEKKRYAEMIEKGAKKEIINRLFRKKHGQDIPRRIFFFSIPAKNIHSPKKRAKSNLGIEVKAFMSTKVKLFLKWRSRKKLKG